MATLSSSIHTLLTTALIIFFTASSSSHAAGPIKGIYYPSWARNNLPPSSIKTNLFSHIYYAFLSPNPSTFMFDKIDPAEALFLVNLTSTIRARKGPVRTLFSVDGASEGRALFSRMASGASSRAAFIRSSIETARRFGFDGIDLDWEYPQSTTEMNNLAVLLMEWRAAVRQEASRSGRAQLLLAAAVYCAADIDWPSRRVYPAASISENLDWINAMCYDFHGDWEPSATAAHAALFDPASNLSTSYGLGSWVRAGVPRGKVIMGMPLYGRTWRLRDPASHGIGAPAVGVGPGNGTLTYAEVVEFNRVNKAEVVYDSKTGSVYSVAGRDWVGYDDPRSVGAKIRYARGLGLGGYFFWAANGDYNWTISESASQLWSV